MGIVRDLYYARKMGAGLKLPAPSVALLIKRLALSKILSPAVLKTVTGALLHITDALAKPAEELLVDLSPLQDLHGYSSPWPGGGGKNIGILSVDTEDSQQNASKSYVNNGVVVTSSGSYGRVAYIIPVSTGTTYTISYKAKRVGATQSLQFGDSVSWGSPSYGTQIITETLAAYTKTFTATSNTLFVGVYPNSAGNSITIEDFQVEVGSDATTFAPYSNICPISGLTGLSVYRTGKNLFDPDGLETVTVNAGERFGHKYSGVGTYAIKAYATGTAGYVYARVLDTDGTWGSVKCVVANTTATEQTVTVSAGQTLFVYNANAWTETASSKLFNGWKVQVVLSSTQPDSYEPYNGNTYSVDWSTQAGTVYGGTLDVVTGLLTVDRAYKSFDGSSTTGIGVYNPLSGFWFALPGMSANYSADGLCNMDKTRTAYGTGGVIFGISDNNYAYFTNLQTISGVSTVSDLCSWLQSNNLVVEFVYPLATPLTYQLTAQEVQMLLGENNLWCSDGADLQLTYYADGNANTEDALNLLLGNRYVNNHTPEDVSDREALDILLGR